MLQQQFWKKVFPTAPIKSGMTYHVRPVPPCPCLQAPCSVVYPPLVACRHPCSVVYPPLGSKLHKGRYIACQCSIKTIRLLPFIYQVYVFYFIMIKTVRCTGASQHTSLQFVYSIEWGAFSHITMTSCCTFVRFVIEYMRGFWVFHRMSSIHVHQCLSAKMGNYQLRLTLTQIPESLNNTLKSCHTN